MNVTISKKAKKALEEITRRTVIRDNANELERSADREYWKARDLRWVTNNQPKEAKR